MAASAASRGAVSHTPAEYEGSHRTGDLPQPEGYAPTMPKFTPLLLATVLAGTVATPAIAAPKINPKSPQETAAYWTAERMQNAKPRERARPGGGGGGGASDWSSFAVPLGNGLYAGSDRRNG